MPCCDIFEKWKAEENLLRMYNYWIVCVRAKQPTLGSCLIILKRHAESFSDVSQEEITEFLDIVKDLERGLNNAFSPELIQYFVLRGTDKHFHFHVLPRYQKEQKFSGDEWTDKTWPRALKQEISDAPQQEPKMLIQIRDEIQKNF